MMKGYVITDSGMRGKTISFGEGYIHIECGTELKWNVNKVRRILSRGISYTLNIEEGSLEEIHTNPSIFIEKPSLEAGNRVSDLSVEDFLQRIQ